MEVMFSLCTLAGMGYAVYVGVKWMLKAGKTVQKRELPLAPTDLKVLEESANRLMADLRAAADECVARVELALAEAEHRIAALDSRQPVSISVPDPTSKIEVAPIQATIAEGATTEPYEMLDSTESSAQVARQSGMTTGEIELLRGLRQIGAR